MSFLSRIFGHHHGHCGGAHSSEDLQKAGLTRKLAIVGNPNVGKSVMFNYLTGAYVTVSNYPGTTVEVARGRCDFGDISAEVIDTPGMYSLLPITEEERVARAILLNEQPDAVLHVIDAKNLERMLPFTFQLVEAGLPVLLALNIMDEAKRLGIQMDVSLLEQNLGIPAVGTVSTTGEGMNELKDRVGELMAAHIPSGE